MTAVALIDHGAFAHNVRLLVERVGPSDVMLAVKADAYGHGMLALAPVALAAGARSLAVLEIPAALALRDAGIDCRLFAWLHGTASDFAAAVQARIDLGVSALWQLEAIAAVATPQNPALVHLKIDTGLHRNGALPGDWPALVTRARELATAGSIVVEGIWSHLADASPEADQAALVEYQSALEIAASLGVVPARRHIAASSAGWREPHARLDMVRFGIAAYGISPFDDISGHALGLNAVMTLTTTVLDAPAPAHHRWIAAGYADGIPVTARGAEVSIGGQRCPVVAIEVDRTLVSITTEVTSGAAVVVFGEPATGVPSAEHWASWARTIGDEIVTGVPARVARTALGSPASS